SQAATKISASTRPSANVTCPRLAMPDGAALVVTLGAPKGRDNGVAGASCTCSACPACCAKATALPRAPTAENSAKPQAARVTRASAAAYVVSFTFIDY